jgi:hypothetical protein
MNAIYDAKLVVYVYGIPSSIAGLVLFIGIIHYTFYMRDK